MTIAELEIFTYISWTVSGLERSASTRHTIPGRLKTDRPFITPPLSIHLRYRPLTTDMCVECVRRPSSLPPSPLLSCVSHHVFTSVSSNSPPSPCHFLPRPDSSALYLFPSTCLWVVAVITAAVGCGTQTTSFSKRRRVSPCHVFLTPITRLLDHKFIHRLSKITLFPQCLHVCASLMSLPMTTKAI